MVCVTDQNLVHHKTDSQQELWISRQSMGSPDLPLMETHTIWALEWIAFMLGKMMGVALFSLL
ncbi:hypothetical protein BC830DRAFT_1104052, partial [Chytriomyces sp. MP71]